MRAPVSRRNGRADSFATTWRRSHVAGENIAMESVNYQNSEGTRP
jgi:hypothetical protein